MNDFAGKRVLIADDRPDTMDFLEDYLKKQGVTVERSGNLTIAYKALKTEQQQFDLTLIDLNLPPIPPDLQPNIKKLKMRGYTLNQGQTLGVWLDDNQPKTKYAYLTAYPIAFDDRGNVPGQKGRYVLNKSDQEQCIEKVKHLLTENTIASP